MPVVQNRGKHGISLAINTESGIMKIVENVIGMK
jgi:hypothetical protein